MVCAGIICLNEKCIHQFDESDLRDRDDEVMKSLFGDDGQDKFCIVGEYLFGYISGFVFALNEFAKRNLNLCLWCLI